MSNDATWNGGAGNGLDRVLVLEVARVTEAAAMAAARFTGRGNEQAADKAAVDAMRRELGRIPIIGRVVIGEGDAGDSETLYAGEEIGAGDGPQVDIAVDPLEGTTICAKAMPNALSVMAVAERGGLLRVPDVYMDKIAIGPGYAVGLVDLDRKPSENLAALAAAKRVPIGQITACILDRPRNGELIKAVRETGAAIRLIPDGDIAGVMWTTQSRETGIDIYLGVGGAPEGVLAAAALRCTGGQIQGRLMPLNATDRQQAHAMGITDMKRKFALADMVSADVIFSATGVTDGALLSGVHFHNGGAITDTLVMRSQTGTVRRIRTSVRDVADRFSA